MPVIITILIAIFFLGISWSWHNLGEKDKSKKIAILIIAYLIIYIITLFLFNTSANEVKYENKEMEQNIRNVLVIVFTIINGLIIIPQFAKLIGRINDKTVSTKQIKGHIIFLIVFSLLILVIENIYLQNVQTSIIEIFNSALKSNSGLT